MSDQQLKVLIENQLDKFHATPAGQEIGPNMMDTIKQFATDAVDTYRLLNPLPAATAAQPAPGSTGYDSALGAYIIEQNPYGSRANLQLPKLPEDPDSERPWVRKSGLLRKNTAIRPLDRKESIPAGPITMFSWEDEPGLREYVTEPYNPHDPASLRERFDDADPRPRPADYPYPPDDSYFYHHNVVKTIRLRYTIKARRFDDPAGEVDPANPKFDRQIAYILIMYTGSDTG